MAISNVAFVIALTTVLAYVEAQKIPVKIAYLADDANDESFGRSFIPKYLKGALKMLTLADSEKVEFTLNVVRTDQSIDKALVGGLNEKVAFYMGDYDASFAKPDFLRKGPAPYIITGKSGFINYVARKKKPETYTCNRTVSKDVVSFFPPRTALSHMLVHGCPKDFRRVVLIGENAYEINLILETLHAYDSTCFDLGTFIIDKNWTKEKGMRVLRNALKLKANAIAIYSFDMGYITKVFNMAKEANMLSYQHTWFLMHPDFDGIPDEMNDLFKESRANVTGFQLISRDTFRRFGIEPPSDHIIKHASIFDAMVKLALSISDHIKAGKQGRLTPQLFRDWVNGKSWQNREEAVGFFSDYFDEKSLGGTVCRMSYKLTYYGYDVGKRHKLRDKVFDDFKKVPDGFTRNTKLYAIPGINYAPPATNPRDDYIPSHLTGYGTLPYCYIQYPPKNMPVFFNNHIRAVAIVTPPMVMHNTIEGKQGNYTGMMVDYLKHYSDELNVTYSIDATVNNRRELYLALDSGMFDVGIGSLGMSGIRYKQADYTDTVRLGRIALLTKKPTVKSYSWQFLQPFTWAVWVSLGVVFIVTSILLTLMDILDWTDESFPVRDSFYYTAGLLCAGSTDTTPATVPSRLMICCLMFFAIVVSNSYTANMTAFLTMRKSEDLPQTLQALAAQNSINYSYVRDSEIFRIFTDNDNDPYVAIVNRQKTKGIPLFSNIIEGVEAVKTKKKDNIGNTILITEEYTAKYYSAQHCDLRVVLQPSEPIYYTMMLPYGATYRENLNEAILAVREGYKDFDTVEEYYKQVDCGTGDEVAENSKTRRLKWEEMDGVFYVLMMGAGLAIIVGLIGEVYVRMILKKERKRHPWKDFKDECKNQIAALRDMCPGGGADSKKK